MCICVSLCKKGKVLMIYAKICMHSRSHKYCEKKIFKKWSRFSPQIAYGMYVGLCRAIWYIFLSSLRYLAICSIQELKNAKSICNKGYNSYFWLSARKDQPTNGDREREKKIEFSINLIHSTIYGLQFCDLHQIAVRFCCCCCLLWSLALDYYVCRYWCMYVVQNGSFVGFANEMCYAYNISINMI